LDRSSFIIFTGINSPLPVRYVLMSLEVSVFFRKAIVDDKYLWRVLNCF